MCEKYNIEEKHIQARAHKKNMGNFRFALSNKMNNIKIIMQTFPITIHKDCVGGCVVSSITGVDPAPPSFARANSHRKYVTMALVAHVRWSATAHVQPPASQ